MAALVSDLGVRRAGRRQVIALGAKAALAGIAASTGRLAQALAAQAAALPDVDAPRSRLAAEIAGYPGMVAVAVTDLQTDRTIEVNGDRPQVAGCTANLL